MLPDDSFIVKLLCIYRFYPDSIEWVVTTDTYSTILPPLTLKKR
jgi:hypothetical protein